MIHPKDARAENPRIQCVVCGKWKRLHTNKTYPPYGLQQTFLGGCGYAQEIGKGDDHLASKGDDSDVCETCCHIECKRIAASLARST